MPGDGLIINQVVLPGEQVTDWLKQCCLPSVRPEYKSGTPDAPVESKSGDAKAHLRKLTPGVVNGPLLPLRPVLPERLRALARRRGCACAMVWRN
jgi:hypothetical protein